MSNNIRYADHDYCLPKFKQETYDQKYSFSPPLFSAYQLSCELTQKDKSGFSNYYSPIETLREFSISEQKMDRWIDEIREWLNALFQHLVKEMQQVEEYLELKQWPHLSLNNHVPAADSGYMTSLSSLLQVPDKQAQSRVKLERYLFMADYPLQKRAYIIRRIHELASGHALAEYRWNMGSPTDAELVLHVFCTFLDLKMPGSFLSDAPFSSKYLDNGQIHIKTGSHYTLYKSGSTYDSFPGRNNLFAILCLFLKNYSILDTLDLEQVGLKFT